MKENGYTNIDALDACEVMLETSRQYHAYTNYITAHLGKNRLPIEDGKLLPALQNYIPPVNTFFSHKLLVLKRLTNSLLKRVTCTRPSIYVLNAPGGGRAQGVEAHCACVLLSLWCDICLRTKTAWVDLEPGNFCTRTKRITSNYFIWAHHSINGLVGYE